MPLMAATCGFVAVVAECANQAWTRRRKGAATPQRDQMYAEARHRDIKDRSQTNKKQLRDALGR